jgi:hypothetical protein
MESFIATTRGSVSYEDAFVGAKIQYVLVVRLETCTTKNWEEVVIGSEVKKSLKG